MRAKFLLFRISSVGMNDALLMRKSVVRAHDAEPKYGLQDHCNEQATDLETSRQDACLQTALVSETDFYGPVV